MQENRGQGYSSHPGDLGRQWEYACEPGRARPSHKALAGTMVSLAPDSLGLVRKKHINWLQTHKCTKKHKVRSPVHTGPQHSDMPPEAPCSSESLYDLRCIRPVVTSLFFVYHMIKILAGCCSPILQLKGKVQPKLVLRFLELTKKFPFLSWRSQQLGSQGLYNGHGQYNEVPLTVPAGGSIYFTLWRIGNSPVVERTARLRDGWEQSQELELHTIGLPSDFPVDLGPKGCWP